MFLNARHSFRTEMQPMSRTFAYARISTPDQNSDNQVLEIEAAGFAIEPFRIITETVSGSYPLSERKGFAKLLEKMEPGDVLVVTKLDRLGRNAMDVAATVDRLEQLGIKVHCLALGGVDLTSSAGKLTMGVITAVAQFERDLLIERTQAGLARAKASGKRLGRPHALSEAQQSEALAMLTDGQSIRKVAMAFDVSRATVQRLRDSHSR